MRGALEYWAPGASMRSPISPVTTRCTYGLGGVPARWGQWRRSLPPRGRLHVGRHMVEESARQSPRRFQAPSAKRPEGTAGGQLRTEPLGSGTSHPPPRGPAGRAQRTTRERDAAGRPRGCSEQGGDSGARVLSTLSPPETFSSESGLTCPHSPALQAPEPGREGVEAVSLKGSGVLSSDGHGQEQGRA